MHSVESISFNDKDEVKTVKFGEAILWDEESGGYGWERDAADVVLMQSTGLLDKNGKECYEGDIVLIKGLKYEVTWNAKWAMFDPMTNIEEEPFEILGNVYEDANLLTKQ